MISGLALPSVDELRALRWTSSGRRRQCRALDPSDRADRDALYRAAAPVDRARRYHSTVELFPAIRRCRPRFWVTRVL